MYRFMNKVYPILAMTCILCGLLVIPGFAQKPVPVSALETSPTHWDQTRVWKLDGANRVIDTRDQRIQSVSQLREGPYSGAPEAAARAFLVDHKAWAGIDPTEANLKVIRVVESPLGTHVTFVRVIGGVEVYPGNLVVSFSKDHYVIFYYSSLYAFSDPVETSPGLSAEQAAERAVTYLKATGTSTYTPQTELVVWAGDNRDFAPLLEVPRVL